MCVRLFSCIISACTLYYCNTVRWAWLDWGLSGWLTTLLQCFDTDGWVIRPVKTVGHITYIVLVQTLNHAQSICCLGKPVLFSSPSVTFSICCRPVQLSGQTNTCHILLCVSDISLCLITSSLLLDIVWSNQHRLSFPNLPCQPFISSQQFSDLCTFSPLSILDLHIDLIILFHFSPTLLHDLLVRNCCRILYYNYAIIMLKQTISINRSIQQTINIRTDCAHTNTHICSL